MDVQQNIKDGKYNNTFDYDANREAYRTEDARLDSLFRADLADELKRSGVPAKYCAGAVDHAWTESHSGGLMEIQGYASEMTWVVFSLGKRKASGTKKPAKKGSRNGS